jgi:hypothetical protein
MRRDGIYRDGGAPRAARRWDRPLRHNRAVPLLGAHVEASGGLHLAFQRAAAMGAQAIQVHPTPPHYWGSPKLDDDRIQRFREAADAAGNPPFYFHAVYLINLAGSDPVLRQRSESTRGPASSSACPPSPATWSTCWSGPTPGAPGC